MMDLMKGGGGGWLHKHVVCNLAYSLVTGLLVPFARREEEALLRIIAPHFLEFLNCLVLPEEG